MDNEHVQRIIKWRESFTLLPENHFFELMRMYLGNVKTPFNKQKLVEELGAFIRNPETKKTIISLLSENDVRILCAIYFIKQATHEKLAEFFEADYVFSNLYERLLNLEERLIIYRYSDKNTHKTIIEINPMLENELKPFLEERFILGESKVVSPADDSGFSLSPEFIAEILNYIRNDSGLCKIDGTLKKRSAEKIESLFPGKMAVVTGLLKAFINLSLVMEAEDGILIDSKRFEAFAALPFVTQVLYLAVASQGRYSREWLVKQSELLLKCAQSVPDAGFTARVLVRSSYVLGLSEGDVTEVAATSRFTKMLSRARSENEKSGENSGTAGAGTTKNETSDAGNAEGAISSASGESSISRAEFSSGAIMERLLETAVNFGILKKLGTDAKGESVYAKGSVFEKEYHDDAKVLSIDAGFNVTVLPGLSLKSLLPLTEFMNLVNADTAATFEINRKSVMQAFDNGVTAENISELLEKHSLYEIPQNLKISLSDWASSYGSASIYKGFVLQVSQENILIVEKNPAISKHIKKTLSPGVYLLSAKSDDEAKELIEKSGLDFIGKIIEQKSVSLPAAFPNLNAESIISSIKKESENGENEESNILPTSKQQYIEARDTIITNLKDYLNNMTLIPEQREELLSRLNRKIIIVKEQFRPDSVRLERVEASGIDYHGKLLIIDHAIDSRSLIEIEYEALDEATGKAEVKTIVATPISITKLSDDAEVVLSMEPYNSEFRLSVGRARRVKRVRGDVLD